MHDLAEQPRPRLIVVAPTAHLKLQWAQAAAALRPAPRPGVVGGRTARLPADMHGIVTTYQQVATQRRGAAAAVARDAFVIFDEIHHAGRRPGVGRRRSAWRSSRRPRRLALSGTPFRSDTARHPVRRLRRSTRPSPDYEYGYGDALADGRVVRPVYFPRIDGAHGVDRRPTASLHVARRSTTRSTTARSSQRLRTALSLDGEWLPTVLRAGPRPARPDPRRAQPDAGGLVIATDQDHAQGIADLLRDRFGQCGHAS